MMSSVTLPSQRRFPCLEQPVKCFLSSSLNVRLSACRSGKLVTRGKRSALEEFLLIPVGSEGHVMLKTSKWEKFLCLQEDNSILASPLPTKEEGKDEEMSAESLSRYKWRMVKGEGGTFLIVSASSGLHLGVSEESAITLSESSATSWTIEYLSGELLFLSFSGTDRRLRCDVFGSLGLSENWKGWEVWRFVEDHEQTGNIRIISWMHNRYLCSDETGKVSSVADPSTNEGTVWVVEQAPKDLQGVVLRSTVYDRVLCLQTKKENEKISIELHTLPRHTLDTIKASAIVHLEAAHLQKYTFSNMNKCIGPYPYVTSNKRQTDEFMLEMVQGHTEIGTVLVKIMSCQNQKYLKASDESCSVELSEEPVLWRMVAQQGGGYIFRHHQQHDTVLSIRNCSDKGDDCELCTAAEDDTLCLWRLDPCMPRAISSSKIRTFAVGTSIAIGTTVAMPFAVAGVVGLMGAEMGILANVVVAGLTGAEALASIGVVGTTAAICFRESADSVTASVDDPEEDASVAKRRPFCDWRSW